MIRGAGLADSQPRTYPVRMEIPRASDGRALAELRLSLARPEPEVPFRYLYEGEGPALAEARTRLPASYVGPAEATLLAAHAREVLDVVSPRSIAEMAAGEGHGVRVLLTEAGGGIMRCALLDTHPEELKKAARRLRQRHRGLVVRAVEGDLREDVARLGPGGGRLILLLSGLFGHLHPGAVPGWLARLKAALGRGDALLLGVETGPSDVVSAPWMDPDGVNAAFNRNALASLDARWGADFDPADFEHQATWEGAWVALRLVARKAVRARVGALETEVALAAGQGMRTAYVCPWPRERLERAVGDAGLRMERWWSDAEGRYALTLIQAAET